MITQNEDTLMSMAEVSRRLGITRQCVHWHERNAIAKLRRHPVMRRLAEAIGIEVKETEGE
jgi:DNA-directed RNA polymerase sigma subunit (sigma70/sigma32)